MGNFQLEMFNRNYLKNQYSHIKKTWSVPMYMTVIVIISVLAVFCFEEMGLFNKELNINHKPVVHIGKIQQTLNKDIENKAEIKDSFKLFSKINTESKLIKEKNQEKMMDMLFDGIDDY